MTFVLEGAAELMLILLVATLGPLQPLIFLLSCSNSSRFAFDPLLNHLLLLGQRSLTILR